MINKGIDKVNPLLVDRVRAWQLARAAVSGQDAVHAAGELFLPKLSDETDTAYKARRFRAGWYNASWRTVSGFVGMLFRKEPIVTHPESVKPFFDDVTQTGISFASFMKEGAYELLTTGLFGALVDHPAAPVNEAGELIEVTVAVAESLGLRPVMVMFKAEQFIDFRFKQINNRWMLQQVRLLENVEDSNAELGEFEVELVKQIRVLDLDPASNKYRVRLYQKSKETGYWAQVGADRYPLIKGQPLAEIPFRIVTPDGIVGEVEGSPLNDLFDLNLQHYLVTADYEHACHVAATPTPWITGYNPPTDENGNPTEQRFKLGSANAWAFGSKDTKVGMLEYTGSGIVHLLDNRKHKEEQMATLGARMLMPEKSAAEATETLEIRKSGEDSVLGAVATSLSQSATQLAKWFVTWCGASAEGVDVKVNRRFLASTMTPQKLAAIISAWQGGALSEQELYEQLQQGEVVDETKTFEAHKEEIESNPPMGLLASQAAIEALENPDKGDEEDDEKKTDK